MIYRVDWCDCCTSRNWRDGRAEKEWFGGPGDIVEIPDRLGETLEEQEQGEKQEQEEKQEKGDKQEQEQEQADGEN